MLSTSAQRLETRGRAVDKRTAHDLKNAGDATVEAIREREQGWNFIKEYEILFTAGLLRKRKMKPYTIKKHVQ